MLTYIIYINLFLLQPSHLLPELVLCALLPTSPLLLLLLLPVLPHRAKAEPQGPALVLTAVHGGPGVLLQYTSVGQVEPVFTV